MSRNNQSSSNHFHEEFWRNQHIMDSSQTNPSSRFSDSIVPDDHHHYQTLPHQQGRTQFPNPQIHQHFWVPNNFNTPPATVSLSNFHHQQQQQETVEKQEEEREYLFEKALTPSDVGKLNRLVIPKQNAEKHFQLSGGTNDSSLSFEDESGQLWTFRYSYWRSSQSYVLTKGWSGFVKKNRLQSGDIVIFQRRRQGGERLFIGLRRYSAELGFYSAQPYPSHSQLHHHHVPLFGYNPSHHAVNSNNQNQTTKTSDRGDSRRLRLFGVNLDCRIGEESESSSSDCLSIPSQSQPMFN